MRRSHRKRHGSGNRSSASHRTRKRSRGTVKDKRHAALQARGSRLLSMLADVQQRMAAIQQSEGPTIDISTGSAVVPPSVVFRRRASLVLPKPTALQATPRSATPPSYPATVSTPALPDVRSPSQFNRGQTTTNVVKLLREVGTSEDVVTTVTAPPMEIVYQRLQKERRHAPILRTPAPEAPPQRRFAAAGELVQVEDKTPNVLYSLPKIHGRPPTPPPDTRTAEELAVEQLAPGRAQPKRRRRGHGQVVSSTAVLPNSARKGHHNTVTFVPTVVSSAGTAVRREPSRRASDSILEIGMRQGTSHTISSRRLSVRSVARGDNDTALDGQPAPSQRAQPLRASLRLSPGRRRRLRNGMGLAAIKEAARRLEESSARGEEHNAVVAEAIAVGHEVVQHKVAQLQGSLTRSSNAVQRKTQRLKDLLAETRTYIPREFLFSEGLKGYRAEWAAGIAAKVMGRMFHAFTSSAMQKWKTFTKFKRWQEADKAVRTVQRVGRGLIGRQEYRRVLKIKRQKEAKERRRQARIRRKQMKAATRIQCVVRGIQGRAFAARRRELVKAATMIQRLYRAHRSRFLEFILQQRRLHRHAMANHIQRVFRGYTGRQRARLFIKIREADELARRMNAQKRAHEDRYRRLGACLLLQAWWRRQRTLKALRRAIANHRWTMALRIQNAWRGFAAWRKFASRKRLWLEELARLRTAATRIQTQWRAHVARVKVVSLKKARAQKLRELKEKKRKAMEEKKNGPKGGKAKFMFGLKAANRFFKDVNPFRISDENAAIRIQKTYRGFRTRKRLKRLRKQAARKAQLEKLQKRAQTMFMFRLTFRRLIKRRRARKARVTKAAIAFQSLWRGHAGRKKADAWAERVLAARTIQRKWKNRFARKIMREIRLRRIEQAAAIAIIQRYAHVWLSIRKVRRVRNQLRAEAEAQLVGRTRTERTLAHTMDVLLIKTLEFSWRYRGPAQRIFKYFANLKKVSRSKTDVPQLGNANFAKMCRGCVRMVHKATFSAQKVDLVFARHKAKKARTLTFPQFVAALREIADLRYPKLQDYRAHHGTEARLIRLFRATIFPCRWAMREVHVKAELHAAAVRDLTKATVMMQRAYRNRENARNAVYVRAQQRSLIQRLKMGHAAIVIQNMWRQEIAAKFMKEQLTPIMQKMYDPNLEAYYYCNTVSGRKSWTKPTMLGRHDLDEVIILPDRDTEYHVLCVQCEERPATTACEECGDVYCSIDFTHLHKKGKRASHVSFPIKICQECHYQAASRVCHGCTKWGKKDGKQYCDVCYFNAHGALAHDAPDLITVLCCECEKFTAKWMCEMCEEEYCTSCFRERHKKGNMRYHTTFPLIYWTPRMKVAHREAAAEISTYEARMALEELRAAKKERHKLDMAIKIQAWWRGRNAGSAVKAMLAMRRKKQARLYIQTKKDDQTRKTLKYRLKKMAGVADTLKTDVTYERDMRGVALVSRPPKGTLLPCTVTVTRGETKVECSRSLNTHLVKGNRVRLGKWVFAVEKMENKFKTIILDRVIPHDFKLKPADQGVYIDPWGRKVEEDSDSDDDLRGEERKKMLKKPIPRLEVYRLPESSHAVKQIKKLGAKGRWLLQKAGLMSDGNDDAVFKPAPKRFKDEFEKASAEERAELEKWELMSDDGSGVDRWQNRDTGEITTEDPEEAFHKREMERAQKKELAMDDVKRANMRFQKEQMQKKIAEMKRKKAGGARKKVELTAEQRQERLRRKKASARKNKRR